MFRPFALSVALGVAAVWSATSALAQTTESEAPNPSLGTRLDNFGRNLMGGIFSSKPKTPQREQFDPSATAQEDPTPYPSYRPANASQAPGVEGVPYASGSTAPSTRPMRVVQPTVESTRTWSNRPLPERTTPSTNQRGVASAPAPYTVTNPMVAATPAVSQPLHRRLAGIRESAFEPAPSPTGSMPGEARVSSNAPSADLDPPTAAEPTPAPREPQLANRPTPYTNSLRSGPAGGALGATQPAEESLGPTRSAEHRPATPYSLAQQPPAAGPAASSSRDSGDDVLFANESPILNVRTLGPRRITVGKESAYEVTVENLGQVAADNVVVTIDLPDWADVLGAEASTGATLSDRGPTGAKQFRWKVGPLAARERQKIVLRIVPRESRPIDLAVRWDFTPSASQTIIEVQEPRLGMQLHGPREVLFGKKESFQLEIANSGNGPAENVVLTLLPIVPGEGAPIDHVLGELPAGQKKVVEIELTAREKGQLAVCVDLRCDGEVHARLDEKILVRKPDLELAAEAPRMQYMGTVATYQFRVRNPGNAPAQNVTLTAKLPVEVKFLAASHNAQLGGDRGQVVWTIPQLDEGAEQIVQMTCQLTQDGFARIDAEAAGEGELLCAATATTKVEAMADLALEVSDPSGPVPVGAEATYEIRIHNRGTKRAAGIEVVAYFSRGIEPVAVEGSPYSIGPGQVVFDAIGGLPAGKEVVLKIKARAEVAGNHMFRTEVYCKPLGTKLVGEETTHFYNGGPAGASAGPFVAQPAGPAGGPPVQTADHRNAPTVRPTVPSAASPAVAPAPARSVVAPAAVPPAAPPTVTPIQSVTYPTNPAPTGQPTLAPRRR
ncbi:MAG: hypothetical protein JW809_16630 [Pirellulales bacterium]|nr:hypothetical protein [Pirellulales bacterium]